MIAQAPMLIMMAFPMYTIFASARCIVIQLALDSQAWYTARMTPSTYEALVSALDDFLEYDTYVRYLRLLRALHAAMKDLNIEPSGWGAGYALLEARRQEAERVSGQSIPWPDDV